MIIFIISCSKEAKKPEDAVRGYLNSIIKNDNSASYIFLSSIDKSAYGIDEYLNIEGETLLVKEINRRMKYTIETCRFTDDNNAIVTVSVSLIDIAELYGLFGTGVYNLNNQREINKFFDDQSETIKKLFTVRKKDYKVIKEGEFWFVYAGLDRFKYIDNLQKRINDNINKGDTRSALALVEEILEFTPQNSEFIDKSSSLKGDLSYIDKYISAEFNIDTTGNIINYKIENNGTYIIREIVIEIVCKTTNNENKSYFNTIPEIMGYLEGINGSFIVELSDTNNERVDLVRVSALRY